MKRLAARYWLLLLIFAGCIPAQPSAETPTPTISFEPIAVSTPVAGRPTVPPRVEPLWISPAVPATVSNGIDPNFLIDRAAEAERASWRIEPAQANLPVSGRYTRLVYALAAPFPTTTDNITLESLRRAWRGERQEAFSGRPLLASPETLRLFTSLWGKPGATAVRQEDADDLLDAAWKKPYGWALLPFDQLEPRWKVIRVDGQTPLDPRTDMALYPLSVNIVLDGSGQHRPELNMPAGNWDSATMTVLLMTGTTAMVRNTALKMETEGIDYPAGDIGAWLRSADLTHISNEVPFYSQCPPAVPLRKEMRFCSDPGYIELLEIVGADIIELTGNHIRDWGEEAFLETLSLYREHHFMIYGGGEDLQSASQALEVEHNGNRFVFLGCNAAGPPGYLATESSAGANPCDMEALTAQIAAYRSEGSIPIVTFQHYEVDDYHPASAQRVDFLKAAEAGASIVSGSQAHFPQGFAIESEAFVHYGLGNLFFDQMDRAHRRAFIDVHYFADGRHISTELRTTMLEDYARPRPMTTAERQEFLLDIFRSTGW